MTTVKSSKLDMAKFAKVHRLMTEGATDGERSAAATRVWALATKAGLTVAQAVSKLDAAKPSKPWGTFYSQQPAGPSFADIFRSFDDEMEKKEPGYKARKARAAAEKETSRQAKLRDLIRKYGSEDAIFDETQRESSLRVALEPLADYRTYANVDRQYVSGYDGWAWGNPTPAMWEAMIQALPFPGSVEAVWREYREWDAVFEERLVAFPDYAPQKHVDARVCALEHLLDTMPDASVEGIRARLAWLDFQARQESARNAEKDRSLAERLRRDFDELAQDVIRQGPGRRYGERMASSIHRTNADKRRDVLSMLDTDPGRSDREIARRVGVSPQTVNTWRKKVRS